ncbi:MAG TPA: hypothetical protein VGB42_08860 [Candidatus Thermoplasmatota archaeon]
METTPKGDRTSHRHAILAIAAVLSLLALTSPPASAAQDLSKIEFTLPDFGEDVNEGLSINRSALHPEIDIVEVSSSVEESHVVFSMRLRGAVVADNESYEYSWGVCLEVVDWNTPLPCSDVRVLFTNGNATLEESGAPADITVVASSGTTLRVAAPLALFANFTTGWQLEGNTLLTEGGFWTDTAALAVGNGELIPGDVSAEVSAYATPTASISSAEVRGGGDHYRLTVEGTTAGPVEHLLVGLGERAEAGGFELWSWAGWWVEQGAAEMDTNVTLQQVGGGWASWRFTYDYDPVAYTSGIVENATIEVRAVAADGSWGHDSQACACGNSTGPIPADGTPDGGGGGGTEPGGFLPGFEGAAAVAVMVTASVLMAARRRRLA